MASGLSRASSATAMAVNAGARRHVLLEPVKDSGHFHRAGQAAEAAARRHRQHDHAPRGNAAIFGRGAAFSPTASSR